MNVSNVQTSVNMWALKQALAMNSQQAMASVSGQIVNQLASLDSSLGQNFDISI